MMRSCRDISELLSRSLDEQISWRERWALKSHLMMCRSCSTLAKQMRFLRAASAAAAEEEMADGDAEPGPRLGDDARARLKEKMRQAQGAVVPESSSE